MTPWGCVSDMSNQVETSERPKTCKKNCISQLIWEQVNVSPVELEEVAGERRSKVLCLDCCTVKPCQVMDRQKVDEFLTPKHLLSVVRWNGSLTK